MDGDEGDRVQFCCVSMTAGAKREANDHSCNSCLGEFGALSGHKKPQSGFRSKAPGGRGEGGEEWTEAGRNQGPSAWIRPGVCPAPLEPQCPSRRREPPPLLDLSPFDLC